jgi:hypothetical protein
MKRAIGFLLFVAFLAGCAPGPRPSPEGPPADTPEWCKDMIAKGGKC